MFEKFLKSEETDYRYAIVRDKDVDKLRSALRLVPGARKHGKFAIEIPNPAFDPQMAAYYTQSEPFERVLWPDGLPNTPQSAIKNNSAGSDVPVKYVWVYRQRLVEEYIRGLKNDSSTD